MQYGIQGMHISKINKNSLRQEQTTLWPNEKVQKDKHRSTKHTQKTRVTRTPQKQGMNSGAPKR